MCKSNHYPVLEELIEKRGIKKSVIAARIGISEKSMYNKLSGQTDFWLTEANTIQEFFFPDVAKDYLFTKSSE